jgi:hypothetical protein
MLSLAEEFRATAPERSLLLTFEANLAFVERRLLADLQRTGAGAVTLIVDHASNQQSFADASALTRVGVDYAIHSVRLPGPSAACHAKLYLLLRPDRARLLVASANLTSCGFVRNLEVVDRLDLEADGTGDREGFTTYLEILHALPRLAPGLGAAKRSLDRAAAEIQAMLARARGAGGAGTPTGGPKLLHTGSAPLLEQIKALVPADEVREIIAISPFFDRESSAILALAAAYPRARLRVLKDAEAQGDLNGEALVPLGDRVKVEVIKEADGRARRLHAKAVMFRGTRRAWLVAGSANLTAPAWLRSAADGGNLEAVTLRAATAGRGDIAAERIGITGLLEILTTRVIPHVALVQSPVTLLEAGPPALEILSAVVEPGAVTLCCTPGPWATVDARLTLMLASRDEAAAIPAAFVRGAAQVVLVRASLGEPVAETLALNDAAVLVSLESRRPDGTRVTGRAWLEKPDFIRLAATDRARRHALALMTERILVSDTHLYHVAEWLLGATAAMEADLRAIGESGIADTGAGGGVSGLNHSNSEEARVRGGGAVGAGRGSAGGDTPGAPTGAPAPWDANWEEEDSEVGPVDIDPGFLADDSDPDGGHESGRSGHGSTRRLGRLDSYLRSTTRLVDRLFQQGVGAPALPPRRGTGQPDQDLDPSDDKWDSATAGEWPNASGDADRLLADSAENAGRAVAHAIRVVPTPASVARVCDTLEVLGAYLFRLELQARHWESAAVATCVQARQRAATRVWSVDGWERGLCRAWMVRAMVYPGAEEAVALAWRDQDRVARLLALEAAGAALGAGSAPAGIIAGIEAVTRERAVLYGPIGPRLRLHAETLSHNSGGRITTERVLEALTPASPAVIGAVNGSGAVARTAGAAVVVPWLPLVPVLQARERGVTAGALDQIVAEAGLQGTAASVARQILRVRRLAGLTQSSGLPSCGFCHVSFSTARAQELGQPGLQLLACENCGALLIPVAWHDPLVRGLLTALTGTDELVGTGNPPADLLNTPGIVRGE